MEILYKYKIYNKDIYPSSLSQELELFSLTIVNFSLGHVSSFKLTSYAVLKK